MSAARARARLPRRVPLGLGNTVKVVLVTKAQLKEIIDDDDPENEYDGYWDVENLTIYINRNIKTAERIKTYWHELVHAVHDLSGN